MYVFGIKIAVMQVYFILMILTVFSLAIAIVLILRLNKLTPKKVVRKEVVEKVPNSLLDYIKKCVKKGYASKDVKRALIKNGWKKDIVEKAINNLR